MKEHLGEISADSLPQFVIFPNSIASASALLWLRITGQTDTTTVPSAILLTLVANGTSIRAPNIPVLSGNLENVGARWRGSQGTVSRWLIGLVFIDYLHIQFVLQVDVVGIVRVVRGHLVLLSRGFSLLPWDEAIRFWYSRTCFDDGRPAFSRAL